MKAFTKILAGGVAIAALAGAAPASAQYYPGYGYGGGDVLGQVIGSVLGGGYGYGASRIDSQAVVNQCASAVQARLSGGGYGGYGGYGYGAGYGGYGGYAPAYGYGSPYGPAARVLGISRVEQRSAGGLTVRGVATTGGYGGYGYANQSRVDLTWKCKADFRGLITDIHIDRAQTNYGYQQQPSYTPWGTDYSQYGYRRY